jgi:hypothetical protein
VVVHHPSSGLLRDDLAVAPHVNRCAVISRGFARHPSSSAERPPHSHCKILFRFAVLRLHAFSTSLGRSPELSYSFACAVRTGDNDASGILLVRWLQFISNRWEIPVFNKLNSSFDRRSEFQYAGQGAPGVRSQKPVADQEAAGVVPDSLLHRTGEFPRRLPFRRFVHTGWCSAAGAIVRGNASPASDAGETRRWGVHAVEEVAGLGCRPIEPLLLQKPEFVLEENRVYRTLLDGHAPHRRLTKPEESRWPKRASRSTNGFRTSSRPSKPKHSSKGIAN